jgi:hypothetical protein
MITTTDLNFHESIYPDFGQKQITVLDGLERKIISVVGASISQQAHQTYSYRWHGQDTLSWGNVDKWIDLKLLVGLLVGLIENSAVLAYQEQYLIIQGIQSIRNLNDIQDKYMIHLAEDVKAFLYNHPGVANVIIEAHPHLLDAFGKFIRVKMQMVKDPEIDNFEQLIAYIITDMSVEQALASLNQFDYQWYLNQLGRLDGNFSFNLDFV